MINPDPIIEATKVASVTDTNANGVTDLGDVITYTITVENKGNVTLKDVTLADTLKDLNGNTLSLTEGPVSSAGTEVIKQLGTSISGENSNDESGKRIAINGDGTVVAIGATGNDGVGNSVFEAGHVGVYKWNGNAWVQRLSLIHI